MEIVNLLGSNVETLALAGQFWAWAALAFALILSCLPLMGWLDELGARDDDLEEEVVVNRHFDQAIAWWEYEIRHPCLAFVLGGDDLEPGDVVFLGYEPNLEPKPARVIADRFRFANSLSPSMRAEFLGHAQEFRAAASGIAVALNSLHRRAELDRERNNAPARIRYPEHRLPLELHLEDLERRLEILVARAEARAGGDWAVWS